MNYDTKAKYVRPNNTTLYKSLMEFDLAFTNYCNSVEYLSSAGYDKQSVIDIIIRIDQRDYYHYIFHNMPHGLNEIKKTAIFCYCVLKYRPLVFAFREKTENEKNDKAAKIKYDNAHAFFAERFCLHFLDDICWDIKGEGIRISNQNRAGLEYTLRHTDISKEVMSTIFELLVDINSIHA